MFLEDPSSITPKCSHSDSPPQNYSVGPCFFLETSTFGCWVVLRVTGLSTWAAAAGVTGMENLSSVVTVITPPHIRVFSFPLLLFLLYGRQMKLLPQIAVFSSDRSWHCTPFTQHSISASSSLYVSLFLSFLKKM